LVDLARALRVLQFLETHGVSVTWDETAIAFYPPHPVAADVAEALASIMRPGPDGRSSLDAAWERHTPLLKSIHASKLSDAPDDQWRRAIDGLRIFLLSGLGDEAERLGWVHDELYRVPAAWSQTRLTGKALQIGDHEVAEITADAIRIRTDDGASQVFYRCAAPDLGPASSDEAAPEPAKLLCDEHVAILRAVETARPPDVSDIDDVDVEIRIHVRWQTAMRGLRAFLANGHGDEALRLGWPRDELYRIPELWSQIHLCGVALLIGDSQVTEVSATAIRIKTGSGAMQSFYKRPAFDIALAYSARIKSIGLDAAKEEFRLRAVEAVVLAYQAHCRCDFETAKKMVLQALANAKT
jgi:hypothetical protein